MNPTAPEDRKYEIIYRLIIIFGGIFLCLLTLFISSGLSIDHAPDEKMRFQLAQWIYKHGRLPVGDEPELINSIWGFSYAYTPYLPTLFSVSFMKFMSLFTTDKVMLIWAARWEGTAAIAVTWYTCCAIGRRTMKKRRSVILFAVLCAYLPQLIFLASYLNNDAFGVMCTALILLAWIRGYQDGWTVKNSALLAVPIGMLALTYYNDYAFILCSILFFFASAIQKKTEPKKVLRLTILIVVIVLVIAGWFFVRNFIIHDGDILGINSQRALGEKYAEDAYKPSKRVTPAQHGETFRQTFIGRGWLVDVLKSFIGYFGYLEFDMATWMYYSYLIVLAFMIVVFFVRYRKHHFSGLLMLCLVLCTVIPIALTMYYTYYSDYQAQGRYMMSILLPVMFCCSYGLDGFVCSGGGRDKVRSGILNLILIYEMTFSAIAYFCYLMPIWGIR